MSYRLSTIEVMKGLMLQIDEEILDEPGHEVKSRKLDEQECVEVADWLLDIDVFNWTEESIRNLPEIIKISRNITVTFLPGMEEQAMYFKLKWG